MDSLHMITACGNPCRDHLPNVDCTYAEPTLGGWAHCVFEYDKYSSPNNSDDSTKRGCIFLGSQQAQRKALISNHDSNYWPCNKKKKALPITGIVNCTNTFPNILEEENESKVTTTSKETEPASTKVDEEEESQRSLSKIQYSRVSVNDEIGANILIYLDGATRFIQNHLNNGGSVLVHCQMGISRSATVVIAYLMKFHSFSLKDAYKHVKERRPRICPNAGFWKQLQIYEVRVNASSAGSNSTSVEFDKDWAEQSLANFHTVGRIGFMPKNNATEEEEDFCFLEITKSTQPNDEQKILFVALDYLFGRGILEADLPWLGALCWALSRSRQQISSSSKCIGMDNSSNDDDSSSNNNNKTKNYNATIDTVLSFLQRDDSKFAQLWEGEIYPKDVERIKNYLLLYNNNVHSRGRND